jgi:prefoldin subunit 5
MNTVPQIDTSNYFELGKKASITNNSNPKMINSGLDSAYKLFSNDLSKTTEQRKANISAEVEILNKKLNDINAKTPPLNLNKSQIVERIEIIDDNILVAKSGEVEVNIIPFAIGSLITLLLTLYLFIFYSSVAYSALFGGGQTKISISNALFNTSVFNNAASQSGGTLAMVFLLPAVFLGLGFLIHDALEKKRVGVLVGIVLATLLFDGLMAYKIAQNNYNVLYNQGIYIKEWSIGYAFKDIDFYLILALGFVVYIIWGYLLDFSIKKWQESQPNNAINLKVESLLLKKENLQNDLLTINTTLNQLIADIKTIEDEKNKKEEILIKLKNGAQAIGETELKGMVGEYMNGWVSFITYNITSDDAKVETETANQISKTWTDNIWAGLRNQ